MKKLYYLSVLSLFFLFGCQNDEEIRDVSGSSTISVDASLEMNPSRTIIQGDKNYVYWEEGDAINAYLGNTQSYQGNITEGVGETFARFSVKIDGDLNLGGGIEGDGTVFYNVAYYPYMERGITLTKEGDNYMIATSFPSEQDFRDKSFGQGVAPMVAVAEGFNFPFKNVGGIIKFVITGKKKITKVTLQVKDDNGEFQKIAGSCTVTTALNGTPTIAFNENAEDLIVLACGEGVQLNETEETVFVFAVPPIKFGAGNLMAKFYDSDQGYMEWSNKNPNEVLRSGNCRYTKVYEPSGTLVDEETLIRQAINGDATSYTLVNDVTLKNNISIPENKTFTLDLNGKTISYASDAAAASQAIENKGNLTIINGTVTYEGVGDDVESPTYATNTITNYGTLTIGTGAVITNTTNGGASYAIDNIPGSKLTVESGEITSNQIAIRVQHGSNVTIEGGVITSNNINAVNIQGGSNNQKTALTISGGALISNKNNGFALYSDAEYEAQHTSTGVKISGGTFTGYVGFGGGNKTGKENVIVTGGTFNSDVFRYLESGGCEYIYTKVATAEGLNDVIQSTKNGSVVLTENITLTSALTIPAGNKVTLDLGGNTISYTNSEAEASQAIENKGNLTITNGIVVYSSTQPSTNNSYATNTITNYGELTIGTSAVITNKTTGGASYAIESVPGSMLVVNSGEISSQKTAIRVREGSDVTINGGVVTSQSLYAVQIHLLQNGLETQLDIKGGTFTGGTFTSDDETYQIALYSYAYKNNTFANTTVNISGGTFNGDVAFGGGNKDVQEAVTVTGGTFNGNLGRYTADGWEDIDKPSGDN